MSKLRTFILFLIAIVLVTFAVGNREFVPVDLWPLYYETIQLPVFVIFFVGILIGVGLSAVVVAFKGVRHYTELRSEKKQKEKLTSDVERLEGELDAKPPKVEQVDYSEDGPGLKQNKSAKE